MKLCLHPITISLSSLLVPQIMMTQPAATVLVTAPSNSATDEIFLRVVRKLGSEAYPRGTCRAVRANANSRAFDKTIIAQEVLDLSQTEEPLSSFRFVAATLCHSYNVTGMGGDIVDVTACSSAI